MLGYKRSSLLASMTEKKTLTTGVGWVILKTKRVQLKKLLKKKIPNNISSF
jgi:hypothetical protein